MGLPGSSKLLRACRQSRVYCFTCAIFSSYPSASSSSHTQNSPTLVVSHFTMANIFAAQVQIETNSPNLIPRPFPIPYNIADQLSSFCCLGLFVGGVWVLWVYTAVSAGVPASSWPTKDCEVSHSLDEGEAGARETEEAVVTISLTSVLAISFYVVVHTLCANSYCWMMVVDFCLNWTITMENM